MREVPHNTASQKGKYPLEFIHTDIAGPFPVTGHEGSSYWVSFLDDYCQISEVVPIAKKSEMFPHLKQFLAKHERPERRCHRIRLDDSGKNRTGEFRDWCADRGIFVEVTTTEQHQQNGAAKVLNKVIMDKLHPTLLHTQLDKKWWPEILVAVNYLRNLSPSSVIGKTPYESWYGTPPDLSHLRILGCKVYYKVMEASRKKIQDDKALVGRLLGYDGDRIYRILTADNCVIRSSNVWFNERSLHHTESSQNVRDLVQTPLVNPSVVHKEKLGKVTSGRISTPSNGGNIQMSDEFEDFLFAVPLEEPPMLLPIVPSLEPIAPSLGNAAPPTLDAPTNSSAPPTEVRTSSRPNKGLHPDCWMFISHAFISAIKTQEPYEPQRYSRLKLMSYGRAGKPLWTKSINLLECVLESKNICLLKLGMFLNDRLVMWLPRQRICCKNTSEV